MIIAIDFDGTCVEHRYPEVGDDIGAKHVIRQLINSGHKIILWTMRSGKELDDAIAWFEDNGLDLFGINSNSEQASWTDSPKVDAQMYIDDAAFGAPLIPDFNGHRYHINWTVVHNELFRMGLCN